MGMQDFGVSEGVLNLINACENLYKTCALYISAKSDTLYVTGFEKRRLPRTQ